MTRRMAGQMMAALALLTLGACAKPQALAVDGGWVRLAANPDAPAAAYFTVHGGAKADTLTAVSTDQARKAEMHETMAMNGSMTTMTPLRQLAVPAQGDVAFKPGGRHVMLFGVRGVRPGETMALTLQFMSGARLVDQAKVIAAGDPAPR